MCKNNSNNTTEQVTVNKAERCVSEILAYFLLVMCAVAILYPPFIEVVSRPKQKIQVQVRTTDSIPSQALVIDGSDLDSLFCKIDEQEKRIEERYEYALEQRETEFKWQSYITFLIGIIVSICGFFGYKSIRDLKEDIQQDTKKWAERAANEKAKTVAADVTRQTCHAEVTNLMPTEVSSYLDRHLQTFVKLKVDELYRSEMADALKLSLQQYIDVKVDAMKNEIKNSIKMDADPKIAEDIDDSQMFIK